MPIRIPDQLPARDILVREGVMVMDDTTALRQDIRRLLRVSECQVIERGRKHLHLPRRSHIS